MSIAPIGYTEGLMHVYAHQPETCHTAEPNWILHTEVLGQERRYLTTDGYRHTHGYGNADTLIIDGYKPQLRARLW